MTGWAGFQHVTHFILSAAGLAVERTKSLIEKKVKQKDEGHSFKSCVSVSDSWVFYSQRCVGQTGPR